MKTKINGNSLCLKFFNQKDIEYETIMAAIEMQSEMTPNINLTGNHTRKSVIGITRGKDG